MDSKWIIGIGGVLVVAIIFLVVVATLRNDNRQRMQNKCESVGGVLVAGPYTGKNRTDPICIKAAKIEIGEIV